MLYTMQKLAWTRSKEWDIWVCFLKNRRRLIPTICGFAAGSVNKKVNQCRFKRSYSTRSNIWPLLRGMVLEEESVWPHIGGGYCIFGYNTINVFNVFFSFYAIRNLILFFGNRCISLQTFKKSFCFWYQL